MTNARTDMDPMGAVIPASEDAATASGAADSAVVDVVVCWWESGWGVICVDLGMRVDWKECVCVVWDDGDWKADAVDPRRRNVVAAKLYFIVSYLSLVCFEWYVVVSYFLERDN